MKQTAVEWLYNHLFPKQLDGFSDEEWNKIDLAFKQAKEMEKEQIINAALYGFRQDSDGDDWQGDNYNAEKYYNTNFKLK